MLKNYEINGKVFNLKCLGRHNKGSYRGRSTCTYLYKVEGTAHAVMVTKWVDSPDTVELKRNYFSDARQYGRECYEAAIWFNLPFSLVLAIGPDKSDLVANFASREFWISPEQEHELVSCGIARRKNEIRFILGAELFDLLGIEEMGQVNTKRIARWLYAIARKAI